MHKKLYRSKENRVFLGLLGGIGEYADADPVLVRVVYLMVAVFTGVVPGIIAYVLGALIVPSRGMSESRAQGSDDAETV